MKEYASHTWAVGLGTISGSSQGS